MWKVPWNGHLLLFSHIDLEHFKFTILSEERALKYVCVFLFHCQSLRCCDKIKEKTKKQNSMLSIIHLIHYDVNVQVDGGLVFISSSFLFFSFFLHFQVMSLRKEHKLNESFPICAECYFRRFFILFSISFVLAFGIRIPIRILRTGPERESKTFKIWPKKHLNFHFFHFVLVL